ncbi:MAG: hypothetical protein E2P02_16245 [Acidobacteria bacterium]|nr:MAG: hypothetical protein E2P02_16245 [Acidobacteriota bacterium]
MLDRGLVATALLLMISGGAAAGQDASAPGNVASQEGVGYDGDGVVDEGDLARAAQNPVGDLISLPFQNNMSFGVGPGDHVQNVHNVQPVVPIGLGSRWNLITRAILPVISQPAPGIDRTNGIGDLNSRRSSHRRSQASSSGV